MVTGFPGPHTEGRHMTSYAGAVLDKRLSLGDELFARAAGPVLDQLAVDLDGTAV